MLAPMKLSFGLIIAAATCCFSALSLEIDQHQESNGLDSDTHKRPNVQGQDQQRRQLSRNATIRRDNRRPIWNLAHMVNSIRELDYRLGMGANAVETDITFSQLGEPLYTYHGSPCDCMRHCHQSEDFNDYLRYVREIAIANPSGIGKNLSLLFLDLKLDLLGPKAKARAGSKLAKSISENLFSDVVVDTQQNDTAPATATIVTSQPLEPDESKLRLILSINYVTDVELVNYFVHYLEHNNASKLLDLIGFDVGMNDDIQLIESMWRKYGKNLNIWQGDGFTNCLSYFYKLERLSKAIVKRDSENGFPRKVYQWTIDSHDRIREALGLGVDAIMTNHPERLLTILSEPDIAHNFRLATRDDDPFRKIMAKTIGRSGESARYQRSANPISGSIYGSLWDVISSFLAYIKEIPFLSYPTTTRFRRMSRIRLLAPSKPSNVGSSSTTATTWLVAKTNTKPENRAGGDDLTSSNSTTTTAYTTSSTMISKESGTNSSSLDTTTTALPMTTTYSGSNDTAFNSSIPNYTGPTWYESLASNFLVSMLKFTLPVPYSLATTTTTPSPTTTVTTNSSSID